MPPKPPSGGLFVGLNKGHIITCKELFPRLQRKNQQKSTLCEEPHHKVVGFSPYEKTYN